MLATSMIEHMYYAFKQYIGLGQKADSFPDCLQCGYCCTYFKVPVKNDEVVLENHFNSIVFVKKENITPSGILMKGTELKRGNRRCVELVGETGKLVKCNIYEDRPSVCREYPREMADGNINPKCIVALKSTLRFKNKLKEKQ